MSVNMTFSHPPMHMQVTLTQRVDSTWEEGRKLVCISESFSLESTVVCCPRKCAFSVDCGLFGTHRQFKYCLRNNCSVHIIGTYLVVLKGSILAISYPRFITRCNAKSLINLFRQKILSFKKIPLTLPLLQK